MSQAAAQLLAFPGPALEAGPLIRFDPSQKRFFDDDARAIAVNWHRQKGKDFTAAAKAVDKGLQKAQNWYLTSLTQRQADATFAKAEKVFEATKQLLKLKGKVTYGEEDYAEYDAEINHTFIRKARSLILPNKAEIVSLPGRDPDTLAGLTGNIIFTEFGLFPKGGYDHWRVIFPVTTRGFQVIAISTPRSKKTKFFELCSDPDTYSYHFCPIEKSVAEDGFKLFDNKGRPCTIEQFKKIYGDDAGWAREYGCQFTGDAESLITWAQLLSAQDPDLVVRVLRIEGGQGWEESFFSAVAALPPGRLEIGWDVARTGDLSCVWINLARRDGKKELRFLIVMHNCQFALQRFILMKAMDSRGGNVGCGDATGLGMDSNETLTTKYRDRWEAVNFNSKTKSELGSVARTAFDDETIKLPRFEEAGHPLKFIATDLYSLQCQPTGSAADKRLQLMETENELEPASHCDIAYSGLLALRAGSLMGGKLGPRHAPLKEVPIDW